jgi:uncharacterized protein (DUF1697 family)
MATHVALLRGINVGGKSLIKMAELRACLEAQGLGNVTTYIQSGNVLFDTSENNRDTLVAQVESALADSFGFHTPVVVRSLFQFRKVIDQAPEGFGQDKNYKYNVVFVKEPVTASEVMRVVKPKEGVDYAAAGEGVVYFWTLLSLATKSWLPRLITLPVYQSLTIRNWNTTRKLLSLMEEKKRPL